MCFVCSRLLIAAPTKWNAADHFLNDTWISLAVQLTWDQLIQSAHTIIMISTAKTCHGNDEIASSMVWRLVVLLRRLEVLRINKNALICCWCRSRFHKTLLRMQCTIFDKMKRLAFPPFKSDFLMRVRCNGDDVVAKWNRLWCSRLYEHDLSK